MRYVTQQEYEREVTSWFNIGETIRALRLEGRNPTIDELRAHYLLYNKVQVFTVIQKQESRVKDD